MSTDKATPKRHPLAIAWDEWLASDEGKSAAQWESLPRNGTASRFLENRLHRAFDAGAIHFDEVVAALKHALWTKHDIRTCACGDCEDARKVLAAVKKG